MNIARPLPKLAFISLLFWALVTTAVQADADRFALILGNSEYQNVSRLKNPKNDSDDIANELRRLGFEVTHILDASRSELIAELREFRKKSAKARQTIIYYAGHGMEIEHSNYLVPVEAELLNDYDVEFEAVPLDLVVNAASGGSELQLIILDACRDNPFARKMNMTSSTRSISRGLAAVEPRGNSIVAYAAREGTVALDGTARNSPYATAFLNALRLPGLEVGKMLRQIRDEVLVSTGNAQEPFFYGSLSAKDYYLNPPVVQASLNAGSTVIGAAPRHNSIAKKEVEQRLEIAFWEAISKSELASDYEVYLQKYPSGVFAEFARRRLAKLQGPVDKSDQSLTALLQEAPLDDPKIANLSKKNLTRAIQGELYRLGCEPGTPDGIWGRKSEAALANFRTASGRSTEQTDDNLELYRLLLFTGPSICETFCAANSALQNGKCTVKSCGAGFYRGSDGTCTKRVIKTGSVKKVAPKVSSVAPNNCREFNGKQICG